MATEIEILQLPTAEVITAAETAAVAAKDLAVTAKNDAVAAKVAAQAVPATTGGLMKAVLDDPAAPFTTALNAQIVATSVARRVHLIGAYGQSNVSGRGIPYSTFTDPQNARIKQFPARGSASGTIVAAAEPLTMHDTATGIGPALQFARQYLRDLPEDDIVIIVPAAHGGTPLSSDVQLAWRWGVAGNLSAQAVAQTQAALVAAEAAYPNAVVSLDAILWIQGETDSTTTAMISGPVYRVDLDALIAGVRSSFELPELPFILGQMLPEALGTGTRDAVNAVHQNTPYRVAFTGFSLAPSGMQNGDNLHFDAAGQRVNGSRMYAEFQRVRAGLAPVNPDAAFAGQVVGLGATSSSTGTTATLTWTAAVNAASYLVEYKTAAASMWTSHGSTASLLAAIAGLTPGTAYNFRVTASNVLGSAAASATFPFTPVATPAGTVVFSDDFARADASALGSTTVGGVPWSVSLAGSGRIESGRGGLSGTTRMTATVVGTADGKFTETLAVKDGGQEFVVFRHVDLSNYLFLSRESASLVNWTLWKRVAGTATLVQNSAVPITAGDVIEVTLNGSSVIVKINGTTAITATVADLVTATGYGFGTITTALSRWDNVSLVTI